jgi:hypothetical protein
VHFYSTFWRFECSNRHSATHLGRLVPRRGVARPARTGASAALTSESGPTSRRPEATPPEGGSTPRVPEVRAPPCGVPAFAAPALGVVPRSAVGLPACASRGCTVQRVKASCPCGSKHARVSTIKGSPPASQPASPHEPFPPVLRALPPATMGDCSVNGAFPFIPSPSSYPTPPWDPVEASPTALCPTSPRPHRNFPPPRWPALWRRRAAPPGRPTPPPTHQNEPLVSHEASPNLGRHLAGIRQGRRRPTPRGPNCEDRVLCRDFSVTRGHTCEL